MTFDRKESMDWSVPRISSPDFSQYSNDLIDEIAVNSFLKSGTPRTALSPRISTNKYALSESAKLNIERKSGGKRSKLRRSFFNCLSDVNEQCNTILKERFYHI